MQTQHAVADHWGGDFDEGGIQKWAETLRSSLAAAKVSLGLIFLAPRFFPHASQILEIVRVHAQIPLLAGCSSTSLIRGSEEIEEGAGIVLALFFLPGAELRAIEFGQNLVEEANGPAFWRSETGIDSGGLNGWLAFADPFHLDCDSWIKQWNEAWPGKPVLGGLASGDPGEQRTQVYLNGKVAESGGIAVALSGAVELEAVISQGCTPIGETWTITKAERNFIHEIGNRAAYEVLAESFGALTQEEQKSARGNLFVGLVVNEYLEQFRRGDFLIRNLLGADPRSGSIAIGALPRVGQTIQFQRRDAAAADEDMNALLDQAQARLPGRTVFGGCLSSCNGRGHRLFGQPNHDAALVQSRLGPLGLAGFFCNGEIGPVGDKNFLHGYTASLALFVSRASGGTP